MYRLARQVSEVRGEVGDFLAKMETGQGWFSLYHVRHNASQPFRVSQVLEHLESLLASVNQSVEMTGLLSELYDTFTIAEWTEQNLGGLQARLSQLREEAARLGRVRRWRARPDTFAVTGHTGTVSPPTTELRPLGKHQRRVQPPDYYSSKRQWRTRT